MGKLCSNESTLNEIKTSIEELKGDIHTLKVENLDLKKALDVEKKRGDKLEEKLGETQHTAGLALGRCNEVDQYARRNNLRIYGVAEPEVTGEKTDDRTIDDVEEKVLHIFNARLGLSVGPGDLEASHRVGRRRQPEEGKETPPRAVIVRFVNRKAHDDVISNRKKLKGTRVVVVDDLTDLNYKLLCKVKDDDVCERAWTTNGRVTMRTTGGHTVRIQSATDLIDKEKRKEWANKQRDGWAQGGRGGYRGQQRGNGRGGARR